MFQNIQKTQFKWWAVSSLHKLMHWWTGDIAFSSGYVTIEAKIGLRFCQNSGTPVNGVNFTCICNYGFTGDRCERYLGNINFCPRPHKLIL